MRSPGEQHCVVQSDKRFTLQTLQTCQNMRPAGVVLITPLCREGSSCHLRDPHATLKVPAFCTSIVFPCLFLVDSSFLSKPNIHQVGETQRGLTFECTLVNRSARWLTE